MKVFKMNDFDHVAAESEEQAKMWYHEQIGEDLKKINEHFEGEVSLQNKMLIDVNDLPLEEQKQSQKMKIIGGHLYAYKTFEWVIKNENIKSPCVICSSEW